MTTRLVSPIRVFCVAAIAMAITLCGQPDSPDVQCVAQDAGIDDGYADEYSDWADEYAEESSPWEDEYSTDYGGDDFEDLPLAVQVAVIIAALLFFLLMLGLTVFIIYLLYKLLDALPPAYRLMEPGMVWLLLIPCFNVIWNFFVYQRIARSYQNYFYALGRTDVGDCGAGIGLAFSICVVLVSIPCVNYVTGIICGPAILVLQILYFVRLYGLKSQIQSK